MTFPAALPRNTSGRASPFLFEFDARTWLRTGSLDAITGQAATFARASHAYGYDGSNNPFPVAPGQPRAIYGSDGEPGVLIEAARTNLCLYNRDFSGWGAAGTPTRTAAAISVGGVPLDLIGDDDGAVAEGYTQTITFTGDATKLVEITVALSANPTALVIRVRDTTASANRLAVIIAPTDATDPTTMAVTVTTGTNLLGGTVGEHCVDSRGRMAMRFKLLTTSLTAANTNVIGVYPASTTVLFAGFTGDAYCGAVQVENASIQSTQIDTTSGTVTRAADALSYAFNVVPRALTIYVKGVERGTNLSSANLGLISIGGSSGSAAAPSFLIQNNASNRYRAILRTSGDEVATAAAATAIGDVVELRAACDMGNVLGGLGGSLALGQAVNAGAEATTTGTFFSALAAAWNAATLYVGSRNGNTGYFAFSKIRIASGLRTLTQMREGRW